MNHVQQYNQGVNAIPSTNLEPLGKILAIQLCTGPPVPRIAFFLLGRKKEITSSEYSISPAPLIWHRRLANSVNYFLQYGGVLNAVRPMPEAFGKTLACSRLASSPSGFTFYGPDSLADYHILPMLLKACCFIFVSLRLCAWAWPLTDRAVERRDGCGANIKN